MRGQGETNLASDGRFRRRSTPESLDPLERNPHVKKAIFGILLAAAAFGSASVAEAGCTVNVGRCSNGDCKVNVGTCADGGSCTVTVGRCDDGETALVAL